MKDVTTLPQTIIYFQTLWTSQNDVTRWKKENTRPQCKLKLSISCIKDLNITPRNYKTLRRKHRQNTVWHNHSKILYDQPLRIMEIKTEINKWDLIKLKSFGTEKETISSIQLLGHNQLFVTPWTAARQASLSIINSLSLLKLMSTELVMPLNDLILYCTLLLLPSIFPSIRIFSNESVLCIRWPKHWSFSFSISPSLYIQDWFPLGWTDQISLCLHPGIQKMEE